MVGAKEWLEQKSGHLEQKIGHLELKSGHLEQEWSFGEPVAKRQEMVSSTFALTINMAVAVRK